MEFYIAEDSLRYFVSDCAGKRNQHRFCERFRHESVYDFMMVSGKRHKVTALGTESQFYGVFQQKADMEIAEIGPDDIKSKDASLTPFEQSLLGAAFLYATIEYFAHEHGHGVLVDVVPYPEKGIPCCQTGGRVKP